MLMEQLLTLILVAAFMTLIVKATMVVQEVSVIVSLALIPAFKFSLDVVLTPLEWNT